MNNFEKIYVSERNLGMRNFLQIELAKRLNKVIEPTDEHVIGWISSFSETFNDIVKSKVSENPNFWEELEDLQFRNNFLDEIERELHGIDPSLKAA